MQPQTPARSARPRRTFIEYREIPGLLVGAALGRDVALRRVLGARKSGRIGAALAALLAAAAAPDTRSALLGLGAYACFSGAAALRWRHTGLGSYRASRLLLWTLPLPLLLAALARASGSSSQLLLPLAALAGWALLERGLRRGLSGPDHLDGEAAASDAGRASLGSGSPGRE